MSESGEVQAGGAVSGGARVGRGASVIFRIALAVIVVAALSLTAITLIGERSHRVSVEHTYRASTTAITKLIADAVAGGIRFRKAEVVDDSYRQLVRENADWVRAFVAIDREGNEIVAHLPDGAAGQKIGDTVRETAAGLSEGISVGDLDGDILIVVPAGRTKDGRPYGFVGLSWRTDFIDAQVADNRTNAILVGLAGIVVIVAMLLAVMQWIVTRPLAAITTTIQELADGNRDIEVPETGRSDEIGRIAHALGVLRQKEAERQKLNADRLEAAERRAQRQKRTEEATTAFRSEITNLLEGVVAGMGQMRETAEMMNRVSDGTAEQATTAASASEQASANVNSVASAAEELSASITEITRQLSAATDVVEKGTRNAESTNSRISGLADAANKIGEVVVLIQDISEQTNLLALNATIEAARAGEMGKGFAVVANEVKVLANQTARATEEIGQQIAGIQASTTSAVEAIREIAENMADVNKYTNAIAVSVQEQGSATTEISVNAQEAAVGTRELAESINVVSDAVVDTRANAGRVMEVSDAVADQAENLRRVVDRFLAEVAAA